MLRWWVSVGSVMVLFAVIVHAQMKPLNEQLADCEAWLRVKQDLPCRCDQTERLAAAMLVRAERAERALAEAQQRSGAEASGN